MLTALDLEVIEKKKHYIIRHKWRKTGIIHKGGGTSYIYV